MFSIYKIFNFNKVLDATLMLMFYDFLMLKIRVISFICPVKSVYYNSFAPSFIVFTLLLGFYLYYFKCPLAFFVVECLKI